jgi:hypothetical protein
LRTGLRVEGLKEWEDAAREACGERRGGAGCAEKGNTRRARAQAG